MAIIKRIGYGQVEPNHLSAQRNGQVYAQLPCAAAIKVLENGQFVKYDYENNEINYTGDGAWMLVYNEVKLYDGWRESYKDFALETKNFDGGVMVPRVFATHVGDIFTTNCLEGAGTKGVEFTGTENIEVGTKLTVNGNGYLSTAGVDAEGAEIWKVVKVYTMPDGQQGVKVQRIA